MSPGSYIDKYVDQFSDVEKQVYEVEMEEGMEIVSVNIMQPKFKNIIELPDSDISDTEEYDRQVFEKIHNVYKTTVDRQCELGYGVLYGLCCLFCSAFL